MLLYFLELYFLTNLNFDSRSLILIYNYFSDIEELWILKYDN